MQRVRIWLDNKWVRAAFLAVGAVLSALTVCFPVLGALEWVSLIPMMLVLYHLAEEGISYKKAYFGGLFFFELFLAVGYHWFFYMYPLEFLGVSKFAALIVVLLGCFGLAFLHAIPCALLFPLFLVAARGKTGKRIPVLMPFLAAALWCISEWALTLGWAGVPWTRLSMGQTMLLPMVQTASVFGSYGITFLIVAVNGLLAYAILYRKRLMVAVPMLLVAVNLVAGSVLLSIVPEGGEAIRIAAIQGNVSSKDKWNDDTFIDSLVTYTEYTQRAVDKGAQLVLWPESVIPDAINEIESIDSYLRKLAKSEEIYLFVGGFKSEDEGAYNAVYAYTPDGGLSDTQYFKRHLVPFGEFLPMEGLIRAVVPPLADLNAYSEYFEAGQDSNVIKTELGVFGCLICFDSIFEESARDSVRDGAEILLISTNDSWFSDSAGVSMHNRQAVLRAIETGRYVVRAANTGISSIITDKGEVLDSVNALRKGYLVEDVYLRDGLTVYARIGNVIIWSSMVLYLAVVLLDVLQGAKKKR